MTPEQLEKIKSRDHGPDVAALIAEVERGWNRERSLLEANNRTLEQKRESDREAEQARITADGAMEEALAWFNLQSRVARWLRTRIGERHMGRKERAMRLLEEAIELAQAEGITAGQAKDQIAHVFARPSGDPDQEMGGVLVCMLGWCEATGSKPKVLAAREVERIEGKPIEDIRGSLARKHDADLVRALEENRG